MTQLASLPTSASSWAQTLTESFQYVEDALNCTAFNRSKCRLIAGEMSDFLSDLERLGDRDLSSREVARLFEFMKATAAFIGIVAQYTPERWLSNFLGSELNRSYSDMAALWDAWADCASIMRFRAFENVGKLSFCHSQDLISAYTAIAQGFGQFPYSAQPAVRARLEEIMRVVRSPAFGTADERNKSILVESDWEVLKPQIGHGGYATVHLARLKANDMHVAVKELNTTQLTTRAVNYLKSEINSMTYLHHPNLLELIGMTVTPPFCIVTKYMPNGSLQELIYQRGLKPLHACKIAMEVARALEYLHALGLVHRDLKPANILLDKDDRAIVCDFGLTRFVAPIMSTELGTLQWMAPEILVPGGEYDNSVDVYAYGVILYELATRKFPYENVKRKLQIAVKVHKGERPQIPDEVPQAMRELIERCWAQDRKKRPTMSEIVKELEECKTMFAGADTDEFRKWIKKTAVEHAEAMESVAKSNSDSETILGRVAELTPLDPQTVPTLKKIIELGIGTENILEDIVRLAVQKASEQVQKLALKIVEFILSKETIDPGKLVKAVLDIWEANPDYVISKIRSFTRFLSNKSELIKGILTRRKQNDNTIDAVEQITELENFPIVFEYLTDNNLLNKLLTKLITNFGAVKEMAPAAVTSINTLTSFIQSIIQTSNYSAMYLTERDAENVEKVLQKLKSGNYSENPDDLLFIIKTLLPLFRHGGPGESTIQILKAGSQIQKVADTLSNYDLWDLYASCINSRHNGIPEETIKILMKLKIPSDKANIIWDPLSRYFCIKQTKESINLINNILTISPKLDITHYVIGLIHGLDTDLSESIIKILFNLNLSERKIHLREKHWTEIASIVSKCETLINSIISMFYIKYQKECKKSTMSYDFLTSLLNFLYLNTPPLELIIPILQSIHLMTSDSNVIIFLVHHQFIQYLHILPKKYPNDKDKVTSILQNFVVAFNR